MKIGIHILILSLGLVLIYLAAYSRDEARQVWSGLSIFQSQVSSDDTAKHVLDIMTLHPEHPQSIAGLIAQSEQNQNIWTVVLWIGISVSLLATLGFMTDIKRKRSSNQ